MGLFKKTPAETFEPGRRRPTGLDQSSRPVAFSYYANRSNQPRASLERDPTASLDSNRSSQNTAQSSVRRLLWLGGGGLVLVALLYGLTLSTTPKIVTKVSETHDYYLQDSAVYAQTASKTLSSSLLNTNKLTIDTAAVSHKLTDNFSEIKSATVHVPFLGRRPVVMIEPYKPACILTTDVGTAYVIDEHGRALVSASQLPAGADKSLPVVQDRSNITINLGDQALTSGTVAFIETVTAVLHASHVQYTNMSLPAGASELDVHISSKSYFVKFNLQGEASLQAGTFLATKAKLERDHLTPSQYIDVRVAERAYYL